MRSAPLSAVLIGQIVLFALIPVGVLAQTNDDYRRCLDDAKIDRQAAEAEIDAEYNDDLSDSYDQYAQDIEAVKRFSDEDDRRDALKEAKEEKREREKTAREERKDKRAEVREEYADARDECKDERDDDDDDDDDDNDNDDDDDDNDDDEFGECVSSGQCRSGQICSTERGDCLRACRDPNAPCPTVCAGHCIRR
jgi:Skp family chaperone for outer membrane proteins